MRLSQPKPPVVIRAFVTLGHNDRNTPANERSSGSRVLHQTPVETNMSNFWKQTEVK